METLLADTEGDLSLQPEIDNAAEARLQVELKEQEELSRLVSRQAAKKARYDQFHDEAKVRQKCMWLCCARARRLKLVARRTNLSQLWKSW